MIPRNFKPCAELLKNFGVSFEWSSSGFGTIGAKVVIAPVRNSQDLSNVASGTSLPVIGVPMKGVPQCARGASLVALGKGGVKNAAFLALRILALSDGKLEKALENYKEKVKRSVVNKSHL